MAKISLIKKTL